MPRHQELLHFNGGTAMASPVQQPSAAVHSNGDHVQLQPGPVATPVQQPDAVALQLLSPWSASYIYSYCMLLNILMFHFNVSLML